MAREDCPNRSLYCKYYPGCFSDEHHEKHPRKAYEEGYDEDHYNVIAKRYRNLGKFLVQLCRYEHDQEHRLEPPPRPPLEEMVDELEATDEHLTPNVLKAINQYRREQNGTTNT